MFGRNYSHTLLGALCLLAVPAAAQESTNFLDDFVGTELNPAFRLINQDRQYTALLGDALLLVTNPDGKNIVEYTGALPADYVATLRVSEPPEYMYQALLMRAGDLENNVRVGMALGEYLGNVTGPNFFTQKSLDGVDSEMVRRTENELRYKPFYLRLEKTGPIYEGFYSADGAKWTSVGKQVLTTPGVRISIQAVNSEDAPETPVQIDSFEVKELLR